MIPKFLASSFLFPPNFSRWFLTSLKNTSKCVSTKNVNEKMYVKFEKITQTSKLRVGRREHWSRKGEPVGCPWVGPLSGEPLSGVQRRRLLGDVERRESCTRSEKLELVRGRTKRALGRGRTKWILGEVERRGPLGEVERRGHLGEVRKEGTWVRSNEESPRTRSDEEGT